MEKWCRIFYIHYFPILDSSDKKTTENNPSSYLPWWWNIIQTKDFKTVKDLFCIAFLKPKLYILVSKWFWILMEICLFRKIKFKELKCKQGTFLREIFLLRKLVNSSAILPMLTMLMKNIRYVLHSIRIMFWLGKYTIVWNCSHTFCHFHSQFKMVQRISVYPLIPCSAGGSIAMIGCLICMYYVSIHKNWLKFC